MLAKDQYMYCLWRNIQTDTWISNNHQHSLTSMAIVGHQNHKAINIRKSNIEHKIVILYEMVWLVGFILFKATSNNISVISWRSVLLVDETGGPRENHWNQYIYMSFHIRGHRGRDRMVVGFTTTYVISAYHHWCCEFESRLAVTCDRSVVFSGSSGFIHRGEKNS
jgi:hypothetical protein